MRIHFMIHGLHLARSTRGRPCAPPLRASHATGA
jgi:hypothetical protein